ncbi:MAG: hypothetical protein II047_05930, partial [Bacteroidales bacterium]|nr:hypothetical protein [Bacteroidales bacterium]
LRAGVVVTGGGAELVNCANYIKELSGYSVKVGYPRRFFSCEGCAEATEASAATSMGMILAAKGDQLLNCVKEAPARRYWTAPKPAPEAAQPEVSVSEPVEVTAEPQPVEVVVEPKPVEEPAIEESVIAAQDDGPTVFDEYTPEEIKEAKNRKREKPVKERKPLPRPKFTWLKHIQNTISKAAGDIFDGMENEEI